MNLAHVETKIHGNNIRADLARLSTTIDQIKELTSNNTKVTVHLDSSFGDAHLAKSRKYSKDLQDLKEGIRRLNGLLIIAVLRSAKVPTHGEPLADRKSATKYLKRTKHAAACVY